MEHNMIDRELRWREVNFAVMTDADSDIEYLEPVVKIPRLTDEEIASATGSDVPKFLLDKSNSSDDQLPRPLRPRRHKAPYMRKISEE